MRFLAIVVSAAAICGCSGAPDQSFNETITESSKVAIGPTATLAPALSCVDLGRYDVRGTVVVDTTDGKAWQRDVSPVRMKQQDAIDYCAYMHVGDRHGWRLPDVDELANIRYKPGLLELGRGACVPSIDQDAFPATPADAFWTISKKPHGEGIYTDFRDGRSHYDDPSELKFVRCVHDPEVTTSRARAPQD